VLLRMLRSFAYNAQWKDASVRNTGQISRQVAQQSDAALKAMSSAYWSRQAEQDASLDAYWNRQAVQDHAADNFSDYIRGQQTVQDPNSGTTYKVQSGASNYWINGAGDVGGNAWQPGPDWRQLTNVP
jgi:hypothetical protein